MKRKYFELPIFLMLIVFVVFVAIHFETSIKKSSLEASTPKRVSVVQKVTLEGFTQGYVIVDNKTGKMYFGNINGGIIELKE